MEPSTVIAGLSQRELLIHMVNLVLLVSVVELLWLALRRGRAAMAQLLPNLLAGLSLTLALRLALGGAGLTWIAPCLLAAGIAHLLDLRARGWMAPTRKTDVHLPTPAHGQGRH